MELSDAARIMLGISLISIPTIAYGGYFLLTQLGSSRIIKTDLQASYYRAGHAHAGVLMLLNLIAQLLVDPAGFDPALSWVVRIGFALAPILMSAGFFGGAPREGTNPGSLIILVRIGAVILALSVLLLGLGLLF